MNWLKTRRGSFSLWRITVLAFVVSGLSYCASRERSLVADIFLEYRVVDVMRDEETGKIVELGILRDALSIVFEVGIFDAVDSERTTWKLKRRPVIRLSGWEPMPKKIEFDGHCYFVKSVIFDSRYPDARNGTATGTWIDEATGKSLCFYVLTPDGEKYVTERTQ